MTSPHLPIRNTAAFAVPDQLLQNPIFGAGDKQIGLRFLQDAHTPLEGKFERSSSSDRGSP
jgi:hypothetical protein